MKWNSFYNGDGTPYESMQDWYNDIKYLIVPIAIGKLVGLGIATHTYFQLFHF